MTNLRDQLEHVEQFETLTIYMQFKSHGWARFNIDNKLGALSIQSDWGNWQHVWGGGPKQWGAVTFVDFLRGRGSCEYLTDKLHYGGRTRSVVDGEATFKNFANKVIAARRAGELDQYEARSLWEDAKRLVGETQGRPYGNDVWAILNSLQRDFHAFFSDAGEMIETMEAPSLVFLREQLLPVLLAYLRGEINAKPVDNAAAGTSP